MNATHRTPLPWCVEPLAASTVISTHRDTLGSGSHSVVILVWNTPRMTSNFWDSPLSAGTKISPAGWGEWLSLTTFWNCPQKIGERCSSWWFRLPRVQNQKKSMTFEWGKTASCKWAKISFKASFVETVEFGSLGWLYKNVVGGGVKVTSVSPKYWLLQFRTHSFSTRSQLFLWYRIMKFIILRLLPCTFR